jgi:cytochrome c-type biogenesis protein CcmH/NrfG
MVRRGVGISVAGLIAVVAAFAADAGLHQALDLYRLTEYEQVLKVLGQMPQKSPAVWALMGRSHFQLGDFRQATEELTKAVTAEPSSSEYALWLGRAYGRRAETSSMFTAPGYASQTRQWFEKAVALDPYNLEALNDLFEYYLEAPGFLGGGQGKAEALITRIASLDQAEGYWATAKLAEKRKQMARAESGLRAAISAAPAQVGRLIDLARFLVKQGRVQEADRTLARAEQIQPGSPKVVYAKADLYISTKRNLPEAKALLKQYLTLHLTPDDPPRADALRLLRQAEGG